MACPVFKPPPLSFQSEETTMHVNIREDEKVKDGRKGDFISSKPALIWKWWMVFVVYYTVLSAT